MIDSSFLHIVYYQIYNIFSFKALFLLFLYFYQIYWANIYIDLLL